MTAEHALKAMKDDFKDDFILQLVGKSDIIEQRRSLEEGLTELAQEAAGMLRVGRCSITLLTDSENSATPKLQVFSYYGSLPDAALQARQPADQGIAGAVIQRREPLLIRDIRKSEFADAARQPDDNHNTSFICAPLFVSEQVVGVISASEPAKGKPFTEQDLGILKVFAAFIGKSIHVFQLQKLSTSHLLQMIVAADQREQIQAGNHPIAPDPARLAKLIAKTWYRELAEAGFGTQDIISVTSEVLSLLNDNLDRHRKRLEQEQQGQGQS